MSNAKKMLLVLVVVFTAMQFIRPARNNSTAVQTADMRTQFNIPANVAGILRTSCYDCHSNNTHYPWYASIQPVGWLLADHIKEGKAELNFDELGSLSRRRQLSKLKSIAGSVKDGSMPLVSYTWMHTHASLSAEEKALIIDWATKTRDNLEVTN